jgi:hypothetical protein
VYGVAEGKNLTRVLACMTAAASEKSIVSVETVAFYSSDARDLYKADVYRALALPKGYVLQFRYLKKYIHPDLLANLSNLRGQAGLIFFVSGNNPPVPPTGAGNGQGRQPALGIHPIRHVTIRDIKIDDNTESILF